MLVSVRRGWCSLIDLSVLLAGAGFLLALGVVLHRRRAESEPHEVASGLSGERGDR